MVVAGGIHFECTLAVVESSARRYRFGDPLTQTEPWLYLRPMNHKPWRLTPEPSLSTTHPGVESIPSQHKGHPHPLFRVRLLRDHAVLFLSLLTPPFISGP